MTEKRKTPALRFRGYTDDWEQRKLGELSSSFEYGLNAAAKEYDGENKYIRITDIDDDSREFKQEDITSPDTDLSSAENYKLSEGDILLARTGASVGKSYIYKASDGLVYYAGFLIRARIKPEYNSEFVFQNTLTGDYEKFIKVTSMRSGQPGVNAQEYSQYQIMMPSKPEQDKISECLRNLDNLITLHQRKLEKLKLVKKSMLEKMFPKNGSSVPEIRFNGFTDDWEQRKLSEIATMHARIGWQNLRTSEFLDSGDYLLITGTDFVDGAVDFSTCHYVERERYEQDKHIQIRNGSILITKDGTLGKVAYIQGLSMPATLNAGVFNVEIKDEKEVDNRYLFQYLKAPFLMDYVDKKATGGTIKHLNQNILVDFPVVLPHKAEQEKIGEYFLAIDNLITLHQRKLELRFFPGCMFFIWVCMLTWCPTTEEQGFEGSEAPRSTGRDPILLQRRGARRRKNKVLRGAKHHFQPAESDSAPKTWCPTTEE